ncbi:AI-2E family transporter [Mycobacterium tuberculosis]|uniref:AI-2E family transporter n=1 Tax=Mycobacterium tuberculosis TaxID=1773 RepID=UPI00272D6E7A|nr:AI-2E family transporter [Mycobacterium tuberculosis]
MHLFALNLLYPKIVGARVHLNPLAVTIALMFWGLIWGGIGLVLAVPILHLFALNLLYPKIVGARVHLNPLAVTIALMFLLQRLGVSHANPTTSNDGHDHDHENVHCFEPTCRRSV